MPRTRRAAYDSVPQSATASANTLSYQPTGRPDQDDGCCATSTGCGEEQREPAGHCGRPGLLPADLEALASPRCRAHAELLRQHWLLLSLHWAACDDGAGCSRNDSAATRHGAELWPFGHGSCAYGRGLWRHIRGCSGVRCGNAMCLPTQQLSAHFCACRDGACSLCRPVRSVLILLSNQPQRASSRRQASAAQCKAEACPKTAVLRQLLGAVATGEAALEEVAPTRYNLVRLVLDDMHKAAASHGGGGGPHSPCMSAASSNTLCYS